MKVIIQLCVLLLPICLTAQYTDYLGAGHFEGVTVSASGSSTLSPAENTVTGKGMDSPTFAAGRFLSHATIGPLPAEVTAMVASGNDFEAWIDDQFTKPATYTQPEMEFIWQEIVDYKVSQGEIEEELFGPFKLHFDYAWWQINMTNEDVLRQKVAYALSQILVVSENSDLGNWGEALTGYYDILIENGLGNYRDILEEVSYSIQMGYYLSHLNNAKENPEANTSPDENYAREIMQLFSIGLYELNQDGTRVLDSNGDAIPSYDQDDIQEFAKIFTGLGIGTLINPNDWPYTPFFGLNIWAAEKDSKMVMYEDFHETTEKILLNGEVLPANQTGDQDISDAIDNLFNHQNTPPFISNLLIKRLVKSNPTPDYISRVSAAFIDNGSGVRGDMKAVVKAILMDTEARSGEAMFEPHAGRAKEPVMKLTSYVRAVPLLAPQGRFWNVMQNYRNSTGQAVLSSPTVFNFYLPDFQPVGDFAATNLTAPEFKLHNTSTAINYINEMYKGQFWGQSEEEGTVGQPIILFSWEDEALYQGVRFDQREFMPYGDYPEILVNELDKKLTYGQLSDETRDIIVNSLNEVVPSWWTDADKQLFKVQMAMYFILLSPDYNTMK